MVVNVDFLVVRAGRPFFLIYFRRTGKDVHPTRSVGWVERDRETQQSLKKVGFRSSTQPTRF
ncbi:hypothetical protein [Scytonema sp. NUACC26]|uniref:hypothetical protein n=1 Tax=Scytonema sp. NUACC26 TaxID=3140176 RepID=UPI0038B2E9A8